MYYKTENIGVEKESTDIKITKEHPAIKKNILILKQILLPLELDCLKFMIINQQPIPTTAFYNYKINTICRSEFSSKKIGKSITKPAYKVNEIEKLPNKLFSKFKLTTKEVATGIYLEADQVTIAKEYVEQVQNKLIRTQFDKDITSHLKTCISYGHGFKADCKYSRKSETERIRIKEIVFRQLNIYFPSYPKILQTLETLEKYNFVTRRSESIKKKANFYWILNPQFSLGFQDKFLDIMKL